jgi:hypothetical protein
MIVYLVIFVVLLVLFGLYVLVGPKLWRPRVSADASRDIRRMWALVETQADPHRKIMESAALLDRTLKEAGFSGTLGDKWKKASLYAGNTDGVWKAIKLRNVVAHEIGSKVSESDVRLSMEVMKKALEVFLR